MKKYFLAASMLVAAALLSSCEYLEDYLPDGNDPGKNAVTYTAFLSGDQEVPAVQASGAGQASFTLNSAKTEIAYKLVVANTDSILFAHIHLGAKGENGPVVAFLLENQEPPTGLVNGVLAEGVIKAADLTGPLAGKPLADLIEALENGTAYANVHSTVFPAGELRGQIYAGNPRLNFTAQLSGDQEVPALDTKATGQATYSFNAAGTELHFKVNLANIKDVKFSHIHIGPVGVNGPVVANLKMERVDGEVNGKYAEGVITTADLSANLQGGPLSILKQALESGYAYSNVHTDANPAGEIRGQIK